MTKIIKINLFKGKSITDLQIIRQENKIKKAMQQVITSNRLTPAQKSAQWEQINNANAQLFDPKLLNQKQYSALLAKWSATQNKLATQEGKDIDKFVRTLSKQV